MAVRVYVGDLGDQGSRSEIERAFSRYGDLADVWVARNPPGFAFVFFESSREAENACRNLDGTELCGVRVRVEIAKGPEKGEKYRSGPTCRECGRIGHGVRDCTRRAGYIYRGKNSEYQIRHYGSRRSFYISTKCQRRMFTTTNFVCNLSTFTTQHSNYTTTTTTTSTSTLYNTVSKLLLLLLL